MSEKVFLALVGGRSATPTIMGALQFLEQFDRIKFLLCEHPNNLYAAFQANALRILKGQKKNLYCDEKFDVKVVDGNDFKKVYDTIKGLCDENTDLQFVNVTSAPQEMAFAVYLYIYNVNKDAMIFNVNTQKSQITPLVLKVEPIKLSHKLSVDDYITACETQIFKRKFNIQGLSCNEEQAKTIVTFFVNHIETTHKFLSVIRGQGQNIKTPKTLSVKSTDFSKEKIACKETVEIFRILQENQLITNFTEDNSNYTFRIERQEDYAFLYGDWLEYYIYLEGKKIGFDSIEMSLELNDFKGEIDLFCVHHANALIGECKTGKYAPDDLAVLESKAIRLGGNYCVRLFITTNQHVDEKFINQAKNRRIIVVSGNDLKNITTILKKQMNDPDFPRN